ncbi:hypothetical protein LA52FAK_35540 [Desulforhopalus sp. 52FAK]
MIAYNLRLRQTEELDLLERKVELKQKLQKSNKKYKNINKNVSKSFWLVSVW